MQAKGLNSSNGFLSLFRESSLGFYSEGIAKLVNVSNGISRVKFTFNKYSNNIETAFTKEKNNYYALIAVNGISKKSDNFNINLNANSSASVDKKLTANDLSQMGVPTKTAQEYINDLNATFDEYKINTPLRKISFLDKFYQKQKVLELNLNKVSQTQIMEGLKVGDVCNLQESQII